MAHLPHLITDLALILGAAAIFTLLFKWLRQPVVLGYIIAGFLVGPYIQWLPTVHEVENINIWAEIGVIFLLFSLGLEFSFKKLLKVGGAASVTALVEVVCLVAAGYGVGKAMGWSDMDSIFLGGMLSVSSTTIIFRALDELGLKTKRFASLVFGVLIVEDLVAIVLLVMLSTLAVSQQFGGTDMLLSILKLIFFILIWFLMGIFFLPTLLRKAKKLMSDEMLLIISITLCLAMVVFAEAVGFSPALGAFVMGSILAETTKAEKIEHLIKPVKDLFASIFFVSVGMLIDPKVLAEYWVPIVILCGVTIVGKLVSNTFGALLAGQSLQTSIQAGFSLSQIGEFSFIIATLGLSLGVTSHFLYPIAVAVSAVTTLTTPYLIKWSGPFYFWLKGRLPEKITQRLDAYSTETAKVSHTSEWKKFVRSQLVTSILLGVIIVSIIILSSQYLYPLVTDNGNSIAIRAAACALTLLVLAPFIWAFAIRSPAEVYKALLTDSRYRSVITIVRFIKLGIAALFIGFLIHRFFNVGTGIVFTAVIICLLAIYSSRIQHFYTKLENRFFRNLHQREIDLARTNRTELAPWDAHIVPVTVLPDSPAIGKTLLELQWRERAGINVVLIKRGDVHIPAPGKEEMIFPADELLVLGTDQQIQRLKALIRPHPRMELAEPFEVELYEYQLPATSYLAGKTIRATQLRETAKALVVGVERNNERILNPDSNFVLQPADTLFIVGNVKKLKKILPIDN